MKSQPTNDDVEITGPIVKIAWMWHNRKYEIGIQRFLTELGANFTDDDVRAAILKILSQE